MYVVCMYRERERERERLQYVSTYIICRGQDSGQARRYFEAVAFLDVGEPTPQRARPQSGRDPGRFRRRKSQSRTTVRQLLMAHHR